MSPVVGGKDNRMTAEAAALMLVDLYADFAKYAVWTDRDIPVVVLSPR